MTKNERSKLVKALLVMPALAAGLTLAKMEQDVEAKKIKESVVETIGKQFGEALAAFIENEDETLNLPLTREELFSLPQDDTVAVWSVLKASGFKRSWTVEEVLERYKLVEERGKMNIPAEVWFFKNYPTPHDINLAKERDSHEGMQE